MERAQETILEVSQFHKQPLQERIYESMAHQQIQDIIAQVTEKYDKDQKDKPIYDKVNQKQEIDNDSLKNTLKNHRKLVQSQSNHTQSVVDVQNHLQAGSPAEILDLLQSKLELAEGKEPIEQYVQPQKQQSQITQQKINQLPVYHIATNSKSNHSEQQPQREETHKMNTHLQKDLIAQKHQEQIIQPIKNKEHLQQHPNCSHLQSPQLKQELSANYSDECGDQVRSLQNLANPFRRKVKTKPSVLSSLSQQPLSPQGLKKQQKQEIKPIESSQQQQKTQAPKQDLFKVFERKISRAIELKTIGNTLFKDKNYVQAIKNYSEALGHLDPQSLYGASRSQYQKIAQLSANLLYNVGMCYFNCKDWKKAELFFKEAITINPKYVKALWKRAVAQNQLGNHQLALTDIKLAYSLDSGNEEIYKAYAIILKAYNDMARKQKQRMKEMSCKIFNNDSQIKTENVPSQSVNMQQTNEQVLKVPKEKEIEIGKEESSFWAIPIAVGIAALGIWAYKKLSN